MTTKLIRALDFPELRKLEDDLILRGGAYPGFVFDRAIPACFGLFGIFVEKDSRAYPAETTGAFIAAIEDRSADDEDDEDDDSIGEEAEEDEDDEEDGDCEASAGPRYNFHPENRELRTLLPLMVDEVADYMKTLGWDLFDERGQPARMTKIVAPSIEAAVKRQLHTKLPDMAAMEAEKFGGSMADDARRWQDEQRKKRRA